MTINRPWNSYSTTTEHTSHEKKKKKMGHSDMNNRSLCLPNTIWHCPPVQLFLERNHTQTISYIGLLGCWITLTSTLPPRWHVLCHSPKPHNTNYAHCSSCCQEDHPELEEQKKLHLMLLCIYTFWAFLGYSIKYPLTGAMMKRVIHMNLMSATYFLLTAPKRSRRGDTNCWRFESGNCSSCYKF